MDNKLLNIVKNFNIKGEVTEIKPLGEGFINDTYVVETDKGNLLLQRKNHNIFKDIPGMMSNIDKVTRHLKKKIEAAGGNPERETLTLVNTKDDKFYFLDENGEYWTICLFIKDSVTHDKADTPELAFAGGAGIGAFQSMLSDFTEPLVDTLPGFHDMAFRFKQWDEAIKLDKAGRKASIAEEISWIDSRREEIMNFWKLIEDGSIPKRITHNDTKLSNVLFDKDDKVLCMIDLDTVLSASVLNDFGDAIRSYTNTGAEDDENLDNVSMDIEIFKNYTAGYLSETKSFLSEKEIEYLAYSAKVITFEQVLRFLMDYIDGDLYYKVKSPEHNLIRTRAQYKLLQSIEEQMDKMNTIVKELI